ncbi:MAG: hypothetical protein V4507_04085 [Verrucomicrobiota bacterium]
MKNKRAFSLVEVLAVAAITVMMFGLFSVALGGLQKSISISKKNIGLNSEAEYILQVIHGDIKNMVPPSLFSPVRMDFEKKRMEVFLSREKGYKESREITLIGYTHERNDRQGTLTRYARSVGWNDSFFGVLDGNPANLTQAHIASPDLFRGIGDEVSQNVVDIAFFYHYHQMKNDERVISTGPLKSDYVLEAITVSVILADLSTLPAGSLEIQSKPISLEPTIFKSEGAKGNNFPWIDRLAFFEQEIGKNKSSKVVVYSLFRTVAVD